MWVIIPFFTNLSVELNNLFWFVTLYIIAAFIRLYPDRFRKKTATYIGLSLVFFAIQMIIAYLIDITGFTSEFWSIYNPIDHNNMQNSPFSLIISFCLFLTFCKWDIRYNRIINTVAGTAFGIYLIHDHPQVRNYIYSEVFNCFDHTYSEYLIPYVLMIAVIIFLSCMVVEILRGTAVDKKLLRNMDRFVSSKHDELDKRIEETLHK